MNTKSARLMKHTPTPWTLDESFEGEIAIIKDGIEQNIAVLEMKFKQGDYSDLKDDEQKANAAFIVKAVNSYKELLEALQIAREWMGSAPTHGIMQRLAKAQDIVDKAIAKAEGL